MKNFLTILLALAMTATVFAGCSSKSDEAPAEEPPKTEETPAEEATEEVQEAELAEGELKTGLAILSKTSDSKDAGEEDGLAKADSVVAAVTVDGDGVITNCTIDTVSSKIAFSSEGKLATPADTTFPTKHELGEDYGMKKVSPIGKEWNEQAEALCQYVIGKTIDEVKGIALNENNAPTDEELATSVTVSIANYIDVIAKAVENAQPAGTKVGDKLGLGVTTNMSKSKDAGEKDGVAQAYSTYAAVTFGEDGEITGCVIDSTQANVNFSVEGKITSDINAEIKTKDELGEGYGMKGVSGIGKEWDEQAVAFAEYAVGKKVEDVSGIALTEEGAPADEELATSVTIVVGSFTEVLEKAEASAK